MLSKVTAPSIIHFTVLEIAGVIILCYCLALGNGHVPAWLPMISDCAVLPPEKYPFRLGLVTGSLSLALNVLIVHNASRKGSNCSLLIGLISCFGLSVAGVVNEDEDTIVHGGAAVSFFLLYEVYMIMMTWCSIGEDNVTLYSVIVKMVTSILAGVALIAFIVMSFNWGKYELYIAICEWFGTLCVLIYQWTFALDMSKVLVCEVEENEEAVSITLKTDSPPSYFATNIDNKN